MTSRINPPNERPLVSVITAVFNGEKYIEQTIQSILIKHIRTLNISS